MSFLKRSSPIPPTAVAIFTLMVMAVNYFFIPHHHLLDPPSFLNATNGVISGSNEQQQQQQFMQGIQFAQGGVFFQVLKSPQSPADDDLVLIEIVNAKNPDSYDYTVAIESNDIFTGNAVQITATKMNNEASPNNNDVNIPANQNEGNQADYGNEGFYSLLFEWTPKFPGKYDIHVREIHRNGSIVPTPLVAPSPLPLSLLPSNPDNGASYSIASEWIWKNIRNNAPVPCQTVQNPLVYSKWDGTWLGPNTSPSSSFQDLRIRTGWTFLPSPQMGCFIETFSRRDLLSIPTKKSIWVLGTSVERGVFLSLVDTLLDKEEKEQLKHSVINKCWGRASVKKGNLELVYQDFRANLFEPFDAPKTMECHNDRISKEPSERFIGNAAGVWNEIFHVDPASWPSIVFMYVDSLEHTKFFVEKLPPSWEGTLLLTDKLFNALRGARFQYNANYPTYLRKIELWLNEINDRRVRYIDGMGISHDMIMYGEYGPEKTGMSQHFHGDCEVSYFDGLGENTMRMCSNVTDLVGQLVLGHALGTREQFESEKLPEPNDEELEYCHACPLDLTPFKLVPYPELTCVTGKFHPRTEDEIYSEKKPALKCPKWCLKTEVVRQMPTQSDVIDVRRCYVE